MAEGRAQSEADGSLRGLPPASAEEARGWRGYRLDELEGASVGRIAGLYADTDGGEPAWLVARLGRFGRVVAIPFGDCAAVAGHVWAPFTEKALRTAPLIDPEKPLTREQEIAICAHYRVHETQGRYAEIVSRPQGEVTAQPAF